MPSVTAMLSLYSCNSRALEQAKLLDSANPPSKRDIRHEFKVIGSRDGFDWCSVEGLASLLPIIESASGIWVFAEQKITEILSSQFASGLLNISNAAKLAGAWFMLFTVFTNRTKVADLRQLCDEYIEVTACEPDPHCYTAFAFDCVDLRALNAHGIGKIMCSVKLKDGVIRRTFSPFVSSELQKRAIWALRGQQRSLEEIGKMLGMNKSTVSRHLLGLPPCHAQERDDGWLRDYLQTIKDCDEVITGGEAM
jgi:DNA-binding transcriptional ArsR family regulator